jgi:molybdopterin synthase catalytic subunit
LVHLQTQAPFWKKEQSPKGAHWGDDRVNVDAALAKRGTDQPNTG